MSESKANPSGTAAVSRPLIYVVDDEPMLLELALVILEPQGFAVKTFRDPELALEAFQKASPRPGAVVTDYAMHTMNGVQLIERFRRLDPHLKILLVSGTVGAEIFRDAPAKPERFLAKPYQAHQLIDAVRSLLSKG